MYDLWRSKKCFFSSVAELFFCSSFCGLTWDVHVCVRWRRFSQGSVFITRGNRAANSIIQKVQQKPTSRMPQVPQSIREAISHCITHPNSNTFCILSFFTLSLHYTPLPRMFCDPRRRDCCRRYRKVNSRYICTHIVCVYYHCCATYTNPKVKY